MSAQMILLSFVWCVPDDRLSDTETTSSTFPEFELIYTNWATQTINNRTRSWAGVGNFFRVACQNPIIIDKIVLRADENLLKYTTVLDIVRDIRIKPWRNDRTSPEQWKFVIVVAFFYSDADNIHLFESPSFTRLTQLLFRNHWRLIALLSKLVIDCI